MGQKANPIGLRLKINKTWDSRWYSGRDYAKNINEDLNLRKFVLGKYETERVKNPQNDPEIAKVEVERAAKQITVKIHAAKPGKLIGQKGKGIDQLRDEVRKVVGTVSDKQVRVEVLEVKAPDLNAQLCSMSVARDLEKRTSFRRAMRKVMQSSMKGGAKGIKVRVSGRLNGAEIARTERYMEGRVPLHTLRADIDYGFSEARTTYGIIGVKVWLFKGEIYGKAGATTVGTRKSED